MYGDDKHPTNDTGANDGTRAQRTLLSVLVPSIPERSSQLSVLLDELVSQAERPEVRRLGRLDVCCLVDNRIRSVGEKRNRLLEMATGEFIAFVDDDDFVSPDYVRRLFEVIAAHGDVDVIAFRQRCSLDDGRTHFVVDADMRNATDEPIPMTGPWNATYRRSCWHWCAFRSAVAKSVAFQDSSLYEDADWLQRLRPRLRAQAKIEDVLHHYRFSPSGTRTQGCAFRSS